METEDSKVHRYCRWSVYYIGDTSNPSFAVDKTEILFKYSFDNFLPQAATLEEIVKTLEVPENPK